MLTKQKKMSLGVQVLAILFKPQFRNRDGYIAASELLQLSVSHFCTQLRQLANLHFTISFDRWLYHIQNLSR